MSNTYNQFSYKNPNNPNNQINQNNLPYPQISGPGSFFKAFPENEIKGFGWGWKVFIILIAALALIGFVMGIIAYRITQDNGLSLATATDTPYVSSIHPKEWENIVVLKCTDKPLGSDYKEYNDDSIQIAYNCPPPENSCRISTCKGDGTCANELKPEAQCSSDSHCGGKCNLNTCTCESLVGTYIPTFSVNSVFSMDSAINTDPVSVHGYYEKRGNYITVQVSYIFDIFDEESKNLGFDFSLPIHANELVTGSGYYTLFSKDLIFNNDTHSEYNFVTSTISVLNTTMARATGINQNPYWTKSVAANSVLIGNLNFLYSV